MARFASFDVSHIHVIQILPNPPQIKTKISDLPQHTIGYIILLSVIKLPQIRGSISQPVPLGTWTQKELEMATFVDQSFEQLMEKAPKVIREGFTGTMTYVVPLPDPDRGLIVELNSRSQVLGTWVITRGNAYRITPQKVRSLPLIENDPDCVRRFCRLNNIPLTRIYYVARNENVYFEHPHYQGDEGYRCVSESDPSVKITGCHTTGNPSYEWKILVVREEQPKTWAQFCEIAKEWPEVKNNKYHL